MAENGENVSDFEEARAKMRKLMSPGSTRRLSDFPSEMLLGIFTRVNLKDYFLLTGVSKNWKSFFTTRRTEFIVYQAPHAVVLSTHAKRSLQLQNIFDRSTFNIKLPLFTGRRCYGTCSSYLVMEDRNNYSGIWLVHPLTKSEYQLPMSEYHPHRILMAASAESTSPPDITIIAISNIEDKWSMLHSNKHAVVQFYSSEELVWTETCEKRYGDVIIMDAAIFQGTIYVVTNLGEVGKIGMCKKKVLTIHEEGPQLIFLSDSPRLVVSDDKLILVDYHSILVFQIYELDVEKMEWVEMANLGSKALFVSNLTSFAIRDTSLWNGHSNCVYGICHETNRCYCHDLNGGIIESYPIGEKGNDKKFGIAKPLWYFPHEAFDIPVLSALPKEKLVCSASEKI